MSMTRHLCPGESPKLTADVIRALRAGYGVEDIHAQQIASVEYARRVVKRLRRADLLHKVLRPTKSQANRNQKGTGNVQK